MVENQKTAIPPGATLGSEEGELMDDRLFALKLAAWIESRLADPELEEDLRIRGPELAAASGYSENRLRQKFYNTVGETPSGYIRKRRLTEAARKLLAGAAIAEVAMSCGYGSQDNFTTAFKAWFGVAPGELKAVDAKYRTFLSRMKEPLNVMELARLKQEPLCSTQMGCVKGASDYFDLDWSVPKLFGYSGHAFLINIHHELCPSGPYAWNHDGFYLALRNMGIRRTAVISFEEGLGPEERGRVDERIKAHLDSGGVSELHYKEHQLIAGYDPQGFVFLQPWGGSSGVEIPSLSFGNWSEIADGTGWAYFTLLEKEEARADESSLLASALASALRLRAEPSEAEMPGYRVGDGAWESWIAAVDEGRGSSHGNWWCAMVWKECRAMASAFFSEIEGDMRSARGASLCRELSELNRECAARLDEAKEREAPPDRQKEALSAGRGLDRRCAELMRGLLAEAVG
jgi:AraC-like DNA-binding protein